MSFDVGSVRSKLGRLREKYEEDLASYMAGLDGTTKDRALVYWPSVNQTLCGLTVRIHAQDASGSVDEGAFGF